MKIKRYSSEELKDETVKSLCQSFNQTRLETPTWEDKKSLTVKEFQKVIEDEVLYVALEDEEVIGFLSLFEPEMFIHLFFTRYHAQGKGLGTQLLQRLEEDYNHRTLSLKCLIPNKLAQKFYFKQGFVISETNVKENYYLLKKEKSSMKG